MEANELAFIVAINTTVITIMSPLGALQSLEDIKYDLHPYRHLNMTKHLLHVLVSPSIVFCMVLKVCQ